MNIKPVDVSALSDEQVSSLLALGSSTSKRPSSTVDQVEMLRQAIDEPSGEQLRLLVADLKRQVLADNGAPLSFRRLTGLTDDEAHELQSKSFSSLLTSATTSRATLERLAAYGELLSADIFPRSTQVTGTVIRALAETALSTHYEVAIGTDQLTASVLITSSLSDRGFPQNLRTDEPNPEDSTPATPKPGT